MYPNFYVAKAKSLQFNAKYRSHSSFREEDATLNLV